MHGSRRCTDAHGNDPELSVDAVPTRQHRMRQGQQLATGMGRASPLAQVDQRIGRLLDAQPLGQRGRQQQAALAMAWVSSKQMSSWSRVWEDPIENVPSWLGDTAAVAGAILPGQRAFLGIRTGIVRLPQRWIQAKTITHVQGVTNAAPEVVPQQDKNERWRLRRTFHPHP
jgi:hypothetical protein